jgi:replicative DNA helicase
MLRVTVNDDLPSNIPAEQNLLGALIAGTTTLADLSNFSADWFYDPVHACIYRTIAQQVADDGWSDLISLTPALGPVDDETGECIGILCEVGGAAYLADLEAKAIPNAKADLQAIREAWTQRQASGTSTL